MKKYKLFFAVCCAILLFTSCGGTLETAETAEAREISVQTTQNTEESTVSGAAEALEAAAAAGIGADEPGDIYTVENGVILLNGEAIDGTVTDVMLSSPISDTALREDYPAVTFLSLGWMGMTDVSILSHFPNVETLWLGPCDASDFTAISDLKALEMLRISECAELTDLSFLVKTSVKTLQVSYCDRLMDLSALQEMGNLESLTLFSDHGIGDFSVLSTMTGLKELSLAGTNFDDLTLLQSLEQLEILRVGSGVTDFTPLTDATYTLASFQGNIDQDTMEWIQTLFPGCDVSAN